MVEGRLDEGIITYLISYLPPILIDDLARTSSAVPIALFYVFIVFLFTRTDSLYVNPLFLMFRYHVFRVRLQASARSVILISTNQDLVDNALIDLYEVQSGRVYFSP